MDKEIIMYAEVETIEVEAEEDISNMMAKKAEIKIDLIEEVIEEIEVTVLQETWVTEHVSSLV
jgi:hypothetical protein